MSEIIFTQSLPSVFNSKHQQVSRSAVSARLCLSLNSMSVIIFPLSTIGIGFQFKTSHFGHRALSGQWKGAVLGLEGWKDSWQFGPWTVDNGAPGLNWPPWKVGDRARRGPTVQGPFCMEVSARMWDCVYTMYYTYCWHDWFLRRGDWKRVTVGRTSVRRRRVLGVGVLEVLTWPAVYMGRWAGGPLRKRSQRRCNVYCVFQHLSNCR